MSSDLTVVGGLAGRERPVLAVCGVGKRPYSVSRVFGGAVAVQVSVVGALGALKDIYDVLGVQPDSVQRL